MPTAGQYGQGETAALPGDPDLALSFAAISPPLEVDDASRYRQIFELQRQGQFRAAELMMGWLNDHRLVGDVLAQRYLAPNYTATYQELVSWLGHYGNHPQAMTLYQMAVKRRPAGVTLPAKPDIDVYRGGTPDAGAAVTDPHWLSGLASWRQGNLADAAAQFELAAANHGSGEWNVSAAAYWAARAHLKNREPAKVSTWLRQAAQYQRTFYGQLARRALGLNPDFDWSSESMTAAGAQALSLSSRGQRALALLQVGELSLAEQEMQALLPTAGPDLGSALHVMAEIYQLPSLSLRLGVLAELQSDTHADADLYPVPHWQPRGGFHLDRALLFAMIRQESAFNMSATNASGATGLMQLMPSTASAIAGHSPDLRNPVVNLTLGQEYMRRLLADPSVNNNLFMMAIAYNAGPGMLAKWRAADGTSDPLLFIEGLPKIETRNFVQHVMASIWIYQERFGQETPTLDHVAAGGWPIYQSQDGFAAANSGQN